jgi:hypothetical protein
MVIAACVVAHRAQADEWDKKTVLTVNQPIQVADKLLEPGKYVFKLLDSSSDRHIVQIFNDDQSRLINTVLAIPNYRLQPTGDSRFAFWETPRGNARALRAWFYPGDNFGQEFPYPKHLATIETASVTTSPQIPAAQTHPVETAPEPQPQTEASAPEPEQRNQPVEIAQNAPPPATPTPEPSPTSEQPKTLPNTASAFPLIGLLGLLSVGVYRLLRIKWFA